MADAIEEASQFIEGRSRSDLDTDRLIHAYFDVDLDMLWNTVTEALPPLRQRIAAALGAPDG
jgi:hypothetical protein